MSVCNRITSALLLAVAGASLALPAAALAQATDAAAAASGGQTARRSAKENLTNLQRPLTVDMKEWKLEDAIKHISNEAGVDFEPIWKTGSEDGLDPEMLVTFSAKGLDALTVLEKVLERAGADAITSDERSTWQVAPYGAIQVGPRKMLNRSKRVEVYDVSDLLFEVPVYDDVPEIDLAQVLQNTSGGSGGGGGGGQSIFGGGGGQRQGGNQQRQEQRRERRQELVDELKRLLTSLAEKDQWEDNGGTGGTMTVYQGNIIIDGPDYMHRAIAGYAWWPSASKASVNKGRRYVSMSGNVEAAKVIGLDPFSVTGVSTGR